MANRYWVGGTGTWNGTNTTNWSATSGGSGGASVPTSIDDVIFNSSSGASGTTVTIATGNTGAKSITTTGFARTLTGSAAITVSGNLTVGSTTTFSYTGTMTFDANATITSNGKSIGAVIVDGSGITVQLAGAIAMGTRDITVTQGTFTTNNYSVTAGSLLSNNSNTRTINLGSSTVTLSDTGTVLNFLDSANLTFNAGTSSFSLTGSFTTKTINGGGQTFYDVTIAASGANGNAITGANTFRNLTIEAPTTNALRQTTFSDDQTITGTFSATGASAISRTFITSNTLGTNRTLTCNAVSFGDTDFRDITIAGSAVPASGTRLGDAGGNSGITFVTKDVYWNLAGNQNFTATAWALSDGGTPDVNNFPLAQDTAIITSTSPASGSTITLSTAYLTPTIDTSDRTSNTLTLTGSANLYGDLILGTGITATTTTLTFLGRAQTITSSGVSIPAITINSVVGTLDIADALSLTGTLTLTSGTFDAVSYNVTCSAFSSGNSNTRTLNMGSGLWTLTGTGTLWNTGTTTNLTLNKDTANILLSNNTASITRTFTNGSGTSFNKITIGGETSTSTTSFANDATYGELASTKTVAHTVRFGVAAPRTINTWSITGTAGNVVSVISGIVGSQASFTLNNVTSGIDYLAVQDINVTTADKFYVGANSTDNGNNTNVYFTAAPAVIFGEVSMTSTGAIYVDGFVIKSFDCSISGSASLDSNGFLIKESSCNIDGLATVSALGTKQIIGSSDVLCSSILVGLGTKLSLANVNLESDATLVSNAIRVLFADCSVNSTASLIATSNVIASGLVGINGLATTSGSAIKDVFASSALVGEVFVYGLGGRIADATSSLSALATTNFNGIRQKIGSSSISGSATVDSSAIRQRIGNSDITASATTSSAANIIASGNINVTGISLVNGLGNANFAGSSSLTGIAISSSIGYIYGEEWSDSQADSNTWTANSVGSNNWTDKQIDSNTWTLIPVSNNNWTEVSANNNSWANK
jgi:hypothetical protein